MFNSKDKAATVSLATLSTCLAQYPFKDLTTLPGFEPVQCELELLTKYKAYRELLIRFVEEKEANNQAFSQLRREDQQREANHPTEGDKENGRKRLSYASSRLTLELIYDALLDSALELQTVLANPITPDYLVELGGVSMRRQSLYLTNRNMAAGLLGYFLKIKAWMCSVNSRPQHEGTLNGGSLTLPNEVFRLLTANGREFLYNHYVQERYVRPAE
ncbi:MAG: hypothetical protein SFV17_05555 [Candidatus Obscuribacter sp.]|nr:hypothetical protein [Candidatus Melainabacteria bacterium]MDX1986132.1 hypothetical protein [Candidatus Obscuribacter sp.]